MQQRQQSAVQRLHDIRTFLDVHKAQFPGLADTSAWRRLDGYLELLDAHDTSIGESTRVARGATITARGLVGALVHNLIVPMARIARDELPFVPELFPLGASRGVRSAKRVISLARGMAAAAAPHREVFVKGGMPQDFIEQMESAIAAIVAATTGRNLQQGRSSEGRRGVHDTLSAAGRAVHVLDGLVRVALVGDAPLLANWNRVKRYRKSGTGGAAVTSIPATTPDVVAPAPAASPTPATATTVVA